MGGSRSFSTTSYAFLLPSMTWMTTRVAGVLIYGCFCTKLAGKCLQIRSCSGLTCPPFLSCQPTQPLPSRLYFILYRWANSLPMPSAWRPCVPTRVMKCSERRSTWRYSLRASGSDMMSGHQAPSPSPLSRSSLRRKRRRKEMTNEKKRTEKNSLNNL